MFRPNRALLALGFVVAAALVVWSQAAPPAQDATPPAPRARFVDTVRGTAEIQYMKPTIRVEKDGTIVTTFQVKNVSPKAIARMTIEEFWYDKSGNPVSGDKQFLKRPLMPQEIASIVLRTPRQPNMDRNSFKFSHGNGDVKPKVVPKF